MNSQLNQYYVIVMWLTLLDTLSDFGFVQNEISCTYWWKNVIGCKFLLSCWKPMKFWPIVQVNKVNIYCSKRNKFSLRILCNFLMKIRKLEAKIKIAYFTCITFWQYCSCSCPPDCKAFLLWHMFSLMKFTYSQRLRWLTALLMGYKSTTCNSFEKGSNMFFPSLFTVCSIPCEIWTINVNKWPKWATRYPTRGWALVG